MKNKKPQISVKAKFHVMSDEEHEHFMQAFTVVIRELAKREVTKKVQQHVKEHPEVSANRFADPMQQQRDA